MAKEFKLPYTASEISEKLEKIDNKADLIDGKIPLEQLPDDIGSGGGASSWNDLKDKPFEEISPAQVITWDGNTDGLPSASIDLDMGDGAILTFACYKISDIIVTEELIKGTSFDCTTPDGSLSCEVDMILGKTSNKSFYATNSQVGIPFIYVVNQVNDSVIYDDGSLTFTLTFPETGIWFLKGTVEGSVFMQTNSLAVPAIIKTLDSKYIADMYYDTRKIYHFDSNKTPNPPSYPVEAFGINGYKIFDLTPTLEEFFNYTIIYNNGFNDSTTEITFTSKQVQLSWSDAWMIQSDQNYTFALCHSARTFEADYQGIHIVCEVPEPGIYLMWSQPPSNITFEINLGGELKQIDPKFIPADLDFNLDDYYTKSETYSKSETSDLITNNLVRYYTKSEVDSAISNVNVDLSGYYTKDEAYSKEEVDNALNNIDLSNYYTKTESDNLYYTESEVNSAIKNNNSSYYTKSEIDVIIGDLDAVLDEIDALVGE